MVFSKVYDNSLWLMLKADDKNREKIIEFVKDIPEDILIKIQQESARILNNPEASIEKDLYSEEAKYQIHLDEEWLDIAKSVKNGKNYEEVFILTLCNYKLLAQKNGNGKNPFTKEWLGDISYALENPSEITEECEYEIIHSPFGIFISYLDKAQKRHHKYLWPTVNEFDLQEKTMGALTRKRIKVK